MDYRQDVVLRVTVKGTLEVPSLMPKDELEQWLATESGKASLARMEIQEWDEVATIHASAFEINPRINADEPHLALVFVQELRDQC